MKVIKYIILSSGTVINYGSGSDFLTSYGSGSGSTRQKVTVPTVPVPQHCIKVRKFPTKKTEYGAIQTVI